MAGSTWQPPTARRQRPNPMIASGETVASIGTTLTGIPLSHPRNRVWWGAFVVALALIVASLGGLLIDGGIRRDTTSIAWALHVASTDWWIGIGSGSLLVSGILLLSGAEWRCAVNRIAETVACLATLAAVLYPILQLRQRVSLHRYLPEVDGSGPASQLHSPLAWDTTGILALLVVTLSLWSIGLLPDLAALRDRALEAARAIPVDRGALRRARVYGVLAAGWQGSATQWQRWVQGYRAVALLGCLLVACVQTGAAATVAGSLPSGRQDTMLPVTFLVGAVLSGVGLTAAIVVTVQGLYDLGALITERHLDILARMLLVLGLVGFYCHAAEVFSTLLHGDATNRAALVQRVVGPHAWALWCFGLCAILPVQIFWLPAARRSAPTLGLVGVLAAFGTYADHVMVLTASLQHDASSSSIQRFALVPWDMLAFVGSIGLFLALLLLVLRYLPAVSITETRSLVPSGDTEPVQPDDQTDDRARTDAALSGIGAVFASEAGLVAAARRLEQPDSPFRLDAYGPVPMPGIVAVIGAPERAIGTYALVGALAGGSGFLALCVWYAASIDPSDIGGHASVSWPSFVIPSFAVATMTGTLAIHAALLVLDRARRPTRHAFDAAGFARVTHDLFVLTAEAQSERFDAERIMRRLKALPADAGRPLAFLRLSR